MTEANIRAQGGHIGLIVLAGPLLAGGAVAAVGWFSLTVWPPSMILVLMNWLAQVFVIVAGVCVAVALTGDPLIELHESTPTGFRSVQLIRAVLVAISGIAGAALMFFPLRAAGVWPHGEWWVSVLSPAGAVVIVAAVALFGAAFAGTASATTIAVVAAWMFLALLWDPHVLSLPQQRALPLTVAALLFVAAWIRFGDAERNISKLAPV